MTIVHSLQKIGWLLCIYFTLVLFTFGVSLLLNHQHKRRLFYRSVISQLDTIQSLPLLEGVDEDTALKEFKTADIRVANLKFFFRKYNSVLYDKAEYFVRMADTYQFDYRLLPAIAMQESNLCKYIYEGSHNCWGWGIYGNKVTRFASYEEAIETISRGIKLYYIDQGLTTPEEIMKKYTPPSQGSWAFGVNTFLDSID